MPANAVIDQVAGVDTAAVALVPYFPIDVGENYKAGPYWTCDRIDLSIGVEPSTAVVKIPLAVAKDEVAPTVAMAVNGPLDAIKVGTTGVIRAINASGTYADCFRGYVTKVSHEFDGSTDYAQLILSDARWLLAGVPIVGSYWGPASVPVWRPGWAAIPNQYSEPNAIFSEGSNCYVFCEPRYGLDDGDDPPTSQEFSTAQACYWEPWMMVQHLRYLVSNASRADYPEAGVLPEGIVWPEGAHEFLYLSDAPRCKEESYLGKNLAQALNDLADQAGGKALTIEFGVDAQPTIAFVPTRYVEDEEGNWPINIQRPGSGGDLGSADVAIHGQMAEDGAGLFTRVTVAGAYVMVERRASTSGSMGLIPGWTSTDQQSMSGYIHAQLAAGKQPDTVLREAFAAYPDVFTTFKVDPTWNFDSGITSLASKNRADVSRPVLGSLLSSYLENDTTESQAATRRPINFEYLPSGETVWLMVPQADLAVDARGLIRCNALRDKYAAVSSTLMAPAFKIQLSGKLDSGISLCEMNMVRATFAIPHDHRIAYTLRHPADANDDAVPTSDVDGDRIAVHTGRHAYLMAGHEMEHDAASGAFRQEWRTTSYPTPEAAGGAAVGSTTTPYHDDTYQLEKSTARRAQKYLRLRRGGKLTTPRLSTTWRLGMMIAGVSYDGGSWPIRSVLTSISLVNAPGRQYTILGFGD